MVTDIIFFQQKGLIFGSQRRSCFQQQSGCGRLIDPLAVGWSIRPRS
ncbi:hypothetical protein ACCS75_26405 [Rhizobium ruizarguesonis]